MNHPTRFKPDGSTEIAKVVSKHGGIYASHIRGEGTQLLESVDEALRIGRDADEPHQYADGIQYVLVNGQPALVKGEFTGALAGKALRFKAANEHADSE